MSEIIECTNIIQSDSNECHNSTDVVLIDGTRSQTPPSMSNVSVLEDISTSIIANSNSNNNIPEATHNFPTSVEQGYSSQNQKPASVISDSSSIVSIKLSKYMKEGHESGNESGQDTPAWYHSLAPSPYHPPEPESSISVIEKMETDELGYIDDFSEPREVTSPPAFISPIYDSPNPRTMMTPVRLMSDNDDVFVSNNDEPVVDMQHNNHQSHYQSPLSISCTTEDSHYDYVRTKKHDSVYQQPSEIRKRSRQRDLAIEYTLQTQMRPKYLYNRDCRNLECIYDHPRQYRGSSCGRDSPDAQRVSYGRETPETQRTGFKVKQ